MKHGIDWRPARCTKEESIKGRILISFLALFCMSMIRFLYPQFRFKTAESIFEELFSFTLTVFTKKNGEERRVWSNFGTDTKGVFRSGKVCSGAEGRWTDRSRWFPNVGNQ